MDYGLTEMYLEVVNGIMNGKINATGTVRDSLISSKHTMMTNIGTIRKTREGNWDLADERIAVICLQQELMQSLGYLTLKSKKQR